MNESMELMEALELIKTIQKSLIRLSDIAIYNDQVFDAIAGIHYPFDESLDELAYDVQQWYDVTQKSV